jgi:hypothetical protein
VKGHLRCARDGLKVRGGLRSSVGDGRGRDCDRLPERAKVSDQVGFLDPEVVVEEVEKLLLHQVDFGEREESSVFLPVHVLGGGIVEVLGGADEDSKEDSVSGALHA